MKVQLPSRFRVGKIESNFRFILPLLSSKLSHVKHINKQFLRAATSLSRPALVLTFFCFYLSNKPWTANQLSLSSHQVLLEFALHEKVGELAACRCRRRRHCLQTPSNSDRRPSPLRNLKESKTKQKTRKKCMPGNFRASSRRSSSSWSSSSDLIIHSSSSRSTSKAKDSDKHVKNSSNVDS